MSKRVCPHPHFAAEVDVHRLSDISRFVCNVRVRCVECNVKFSFTGLPNVISVERPAINIDGTEASLPIEPGPRPIPRFGQIAVEVPRRGES